jgi:(p)ppGpp synthase/HD superfamily hydrolase
MIVGRSELAFPGVLTARSTGQPHLEEVAAPAAVRRVVSKIVGGALVPDDKTLPKHVRKLEQEWNASSKSPRAKVLKLADKTSNLRALAASPPSKWPVERKIEYVRWAERVAEGLRGVSDVLEAQFKEAAQAADRSLTATM